MELTNLARVSDDFYPLNQPSHLAHIANCSFNTLFMVRLGHDRGGGEGAL